MGATVQELKSQVLLEGLDDSDLEKLSQQLTVLRVLKDKHVFREKGACNGIHMIMSGRVEISKTTPDGWKQPLVILGKGKFIGEIATLEKTNHATDAKAMENTELILFSKELFGELERTNPHVMLKIIKNIAIVSSLNVRSMNDKFINVLVNY